jgi:23S rRNA pseudouridine1911/1915/1917 synthase
MPFVKEKFIVPQNMPAFLYIMREFNYTQGEAQRLICKGRLLVDGKSMYKTGQRIEGEVEIVYFKPISKGIQPIFSNQDFMVFEKPSGVLVHPNTMATEYSMLDEIRAIAGDKANATHRIDMETSGLLLASKHIEAERFLKSSFENKTITKSYLAWVRGKVIDEFEVNAHISINNDYSQSKHKVYIDSSGKEALTQFKPLKYDASKDITLLECYPKTGRTHQIRIHLFHMKHPIVGDPLYGTSYQVANDYLEGNLSQQDRIKYTGASRLMLHAHTLRFRYKNDFFIKSKKDL